MALTYHGASDSYINFINNANLAFTIIFILEAFLKIITLGFSSYWYNSWNKFDFCVVLTSIIDLILDYFNASTSNFLKIGP